MGAIAAVALEREPDQRSFDSDEVDSRVWNDKRDARIALILGSPNRNRCMLVAGGRRTHDGERGKHGAGGRKWHSARFARVLARLCLGGRALRCVFSDSFRPAV